MGCDVMRVGYTIGVLRVTAVMAVWGPLKAFYTALQGGFQLIVDIWS